MIALSGVVRVTMVYMGKSQLCGLMGQKQWK